MEFILDKPLTLQFLVTLQTSCLEKVTQLICEKFTRLLVLLSRILEM